MSVTITSDRPASDVLVLFEREDDEFANPEEARFTEGDLTSIDALFSVLGGPCPEDAPCVDETVVILRAETSTPIRYDFTVRVNLHGPDGDESPAPPGAIAVTLEELDAVP